jgi:hypothetical protein
MSRDYVFYKGKHAYVNVDTPKEADYLTSHFDKATSVGTQYAATKDWSKWWRLILKPSMSSIGMSVSPRWVPCDQPAWHTATPQQGIEAHSGARR